MLGLLVFGVVVLVLLEMAVLWAMIDIGTDIKDLLASARWQAAFTEAQAEQRRRLKQTFETKEGRALIRERLARHLQG